MTLNDMLYAVEAGLQKLASFALDNFLPEEKVFFLNLGQQAYVQRELFQRLKTMPAEGILDARRLGNLQVLFTAGTYSVTVISPGYATVNTPTNFMYPLPGNLTAYFTALAGTDVYNAPITLLENDSTATVLKNPFALSPFSPKAELANNTLKVFTSKKSILKEVRLNYVRLPQELSLSLPSGSEMPAHTHPDIVQLTLEKILEAVESGRYQSTRQQAEPLP